MTAPATILDAMASPALFKRWFRDPATWQAWRAFLAVLFGLPLSDDERAIFTACTGRDAACAQKLQHGLPARQTLPWRKRLRCNEVWLACGFSGHDFPPGHAANG